MTATLQVACTREGMEPVGWNVVRLHWCMHMCVCVCVCVLYCCCDSLVCSRHLLSSRISLVVFIVVSYVILLLAGSCYQMYIYILHPCSGHYDKNASLAWQLSGWCDTTGMIKQQIVWEVKANCLQRKAHLNSDFLMSRLVEDSGLLWCGAVLLGEYFLTFPYSQYWEPLIQNYSVIHQKTKILNKPYCKNLKSCKVCRCCRHMW